jgi:DNA-binding response OmpR family regulator
MRVLVIDDDPGVRILCRIAFREEGDEVIEVASGPDGLEILEGEGADAVVLDVMLPSINGFEILRRIRANQRTSDLPVVLLSVRVGIQDQIDGWKAGADEYLTKPFSPSALAAKVNEICRIDPARRADKRSQRLQDRVAAS